MKNKRTGWDGGKNGLTGASDLAHVVLPHSRAGRRIGRVFLVYFEREVERPFSAYFEVSL